MDTFGAFSNDTGQAVTLDDNGILDSLVFVDSQIEEFRWRYRECESSRRYYLIDVAHTHTHTHTAV